MRRPGVGWRRRVIFELVDRQRQQLLHQGVEIVEQLPCGTGAGGAVGLFSTLKLHAASAEPSASLSLCLAAVREYAGMGFSPE